MITNENEAQVSDDLKEKIEALNLLPINEKMVDFLVDYAPIPKPDFGREETKKYDYVRFYRGKPFFYSKKYLESNPLDYILERLAMIISYQ